MAVFWWWRSLSPLLTAKPRVVVLGSYVLYPDPFPADRGQHQPLPEEVAAVVGEPVACHVVVVSVLLTLVWLTDGLTDYCLNTA